MALPMDKHRKVLLASSFWMPNYDFHVGFEWLQAIKIAMWQDVKNNYSQKSLSMNHLTVIRRMGF
jgi:hypothetical protein